jgi:hypothetical protein
MYQQNLIRFNIKFHLIEKGVLQLFGLFNAQMLYTRSVKFYLEILNFYNLAKIHFIQGFQKSTCKHSHKYIKLQICKCIPSL